MEGVEEVLKKSSTTCMALSDGSTQVTFRDRVIGNIQLVDGSMAKLYGVEGGGRART